MSPARSGGVGDVQQRGYGIAELNNVLYRRLDPAEEFLRAPSGCEIRRGRPEEARELGGIVERAFFPDGAPEAFRDLLTPLYQMEGALTFAASVEGKMVACGAGLVIPETSHLRGVRSRNVRRVSRARFADGVASRPPGCRSRSRCEYAVVVTQGGTASQRNCERMGFRVAYSKVTLMKYLKTSHREIAEDAERKRVIRSIWPLSLRSQRPRR